MYVLKLYILLHRQMDIDLQYALLSSGQGEIPDRRYSPRLPSKGLNRLNSGTDSKVWMEEEY